MSRGQNINEYVGGQDLPQSEKAMSAFSYVNASVEVMVAVISMPKQGMTKLSFVNLVFSVMVMAVMIV